MLNNSKILKGLVFASFLLLLTTSVSAQKNLRIIATGEILEDWNWTQFDSCNVRIKSVADRLSVEYPNYGPADILGGNYEGFIDDGQLVNGIDDYFDNGGVFHSGRSSVIDSLISKLGVNMLSPVNNHAFDGMDIDDETVAWGRQGVRQTYECLAERDILFAGIGANRDEVKTPRVMTLADGTTIGMISAGDNSNEKPSFATDDEWGMWHSLNDDNGDLDNYDIDALVDVVAEHSPNYDYFIVYTHWHWANDKETGAITDNSTEGEDFLRMFQRCIDAGADICINDGPHQPCGWDVYNGGIMLFSPGNFFYSTRRGEDYGWKSWASLVTDILFVDDGSGGKEVGAIKFIPCTGNFPGTDGDPKADKGTSEYADHLQSLGVPELAYGDIGQDIFERVNGFTTDDDASLMQTSHVGIEVVTTGSGNRRVSIGYWPSKQVFDSISGGVVPDTVKPTVTAGFTQECGIEAGTLVIKGGGPRNSAIVQAIKDNMGGESGPLVLIPTAKESEPDVDERIQKWIDLGFTDVSVLHTRDPAEANTKEFIQPLLKAKAVFMGGGRQWRLADSY